MPPPKLRLPTHLRDLVRSLHPDLKRRIRIGLDRIRDDRSTGKALKGDLAGLRSYRIGRLRIVYREAHGVIEVVAIGPRRSIYEETYRLLKDQND